MIELMNISGGYGKKTIITDLNLCAKSHQLIALLGANGSGKTTLLKLIAGLIPLRQGQQMVDGDDIASLSLQARAQRIAYMPQHREIPPAMSVYEVVRLGRAPYRGRLGHLTPQGKAAITRALEITDTLELQNRRIPELSGGEQARVLLARALAVDAPYLLADEPMAGLDPYYQLTLMAQLRRHVHGMSSPRTMIITVHDLALASQYADHVWLMKSGKVYAQGTPEAVLNTAHLQTVFGLKRPKGGFQHLETLPL